VHDIVSGFHSHFVDLRPARPQGLASALRPQPIREFDELQGRLMDPDKAGSFTHVLFLSASSAAGASQTPRV
jgi:hypothetical protein